VTYAANNRSNYTGRVLVLIAGEPDGRGDGDCLPRSEIAAASVQNTINRLYLSITLTVETNNVLGLGPMFACGLHKKAPIAKTKHKAPSKHRFR